MTNQVGFIGEQKAKKKGNRNTSIQKSSALAFFITVVVGLVLITIGYWLGSRENNTYYYQLKSQCDGRIVLNETPRGVGYKCTVR